MDYRQGGDCHIHRVAPGEGKPGRYWCLAHQSSATARFGGRMPRCEGAYRTVAHFKRFKLDPDRFPGGVALWGAVEPVYNTAAEPVERGIHVHARERKGGRKAIDQTFDAVELPVRRDLFDEESVIITADTAVAFYISRFLARPIVGLFCPLCNTPHLDSDWYAVKPHRVHLCHGCNRMFHHETKRISNPLELVRHQLAAEPTKVPTRAKGTLDIRQADYPAGLQIWASNPALLWTSSRPEQEGIHVHGWTRPGPEPQLDGTFNHVRIDGIDLDEEQLRVFMAQNALFYLRGKVRDMRCPKCDASIYDRGEAAFRPSGRRECDACGHGFDVVGRRRRVVSNPFVGTIKMLRSASRIKRATL